MRGDQDYGHPGLIEDGLDGMLVPPADAGALAGSYRKADG